MSPSMTGFFNPRINFQLQKAMTISMSKPDRDKCKCKYNHSSRSYKYSSKWENFHLRVFHMYVM